MGNIGSTSEKMCRRFIAGSMVALSFGLTFITGCNNPKLAKAFVSIMPSSTTIGTGLVFPIYAAASPAGVTWAMSASGCGGSACGSLSNATATSVNYNAPVSISGSSMSVTITATSTTDSTVKTSETLTVFPEYVQITGPSNTLVPAETAASFSATVVNDPTNDGVKWSLSGSCVGTPETCGSFTSGNITQASFFSPPAPANETVFITATSIADPAESASFAMSVSKLTIFQLSPAVLPPAIAGQPYTATVQIFGNTPPYTMSVADASALPSWVTYSPVDPATDTFTITGTPPAATQGTAYPTFTITDSTGLTGGQPIAITTYPVAATGNGLLSGSYAFYGNGWLDGSKNATTIDAISYIGSFTADGSGNIIGGELDVNGPTGLTSYTSLAGTYDVQYGVDSSGNPLPASQTALITLIPSGKPPLPITLAVSLNAIQQNSVTSQEIATAGSLVEFDDTTGISGTKGPNSSAQRVQGSLALQDPHVLNAPDPISGNYAFGMAGNSSVNDFNLTCLGSPNFSCGPVSVAGSMAIGSGGNISNLLEDVQIGENTASSLSSSDPNNGGSLADAGNTDASGRVTATINPQANASMVDWPSDFVIYAISPPCVSSPCPNRKSWAPGQFYIMSTDSYVTNTLVTGTATQQNMTDIASTPFSATQPLVLYGDIVSSTDLSVKGPNGQIKTLVQLLQPVPSGSAAGAISGFQWQNASGTYTSTSTPGAVSNSSYTVDPVSGRVVVSAGGEPTLYLTETNSGYGTMRTTSSSKNPPGLFQFQPQTATALNGGTYAYSGFYTDSQIAPFEVGVLQVPSTGVPADGSTVTLLAGQDYSVFASDGNAYLSSSGETMLYSGPVTGTVSQTNGTIDRSAVLLPGTMQGCGQQAPQGGGFVISSTSFVCAPSGGSFGVIHLFQQ